jgi:hypothetical protein
MLLAILTCTVLIMWPTQIFLKKCKLQYKSKELRYTKCGTAASIAFPDGNTEIFSQLA